MAKHIPTDDEILAQAAAAAVAAADEPDEALAREARYDAPTRRLIVELTSGATFILPIDHCQGLAGQPDDLLSDVVVMPGGDGLGWPKLDAHFHVGSLVIGAFGGKSWMKHLRQTLLREAGAIKSEAKARAAKENGKKGGRPRKIG